ncbi:hypothetical protein D3C86_1979640 [compost metagenome]
MQQRIFRQPSQQSATGSGCSLCHKQVIYPVRQFFPNLLAAHHSVVIGTAFRDQQVKRIFFFPGFLRDLFISRIVFGS